MAPPAARRANSVQCSGHQGLRGNPDACHPRRGSACIEFPKETGGDADPVLASQSQPTAAMDSGSGVEGAGGAFDKNPREATSKNAGPGGFPTAFDSKSGAPAAQARPPGVPRRMAGDRRSPLRMARRVVAPHGASSCGGKRADDIRPRGTGDRRSPLRMPFPVGMGKVHPTWLVTARICGILGCEFPGKEADKWICSYSG